MISSDQVNTRSRQRRTSYIHRLKSEEASPTLHGKSTCYRILSMANSQPYELRAAHEKLFYQIAKRALDVTMSVTALGVLAPLLLGAAIVTRINSPGPVLFSQKRVGQRGRLFQCLKIRTMYADAEERLRKDPRLREEFETNYKIKDDPRITPIGAILRKTSIDELPQFLNVLKGDMTLIGPRPIQNAELSKYGEYQEDLLSVKPGLGGLWQVCGRSDTSYEERVAMDALYVRHRCLRLDLLLLLLTLKAVFQRSGAC